MKLYLSIFLLLATTIVRGQSPATEAVTFLYSETESLSLTSTWVAEYQKKFPKREVVLTKDKSRADIIISTNPLSTTDLIIAQQTGSKKEIIAHTSTDLTLESTLLLNWITNEGQSISFPAGFGRASKDDLIRSQQVIVVALKRFSSPSCEGLSEVMTKRKATVFKN